MKTLGSGSWDFTEQASLGLLAISGTKPRHLRLGLGVRDGGISRRERGYIRLVEAMRKVPPPPCAGCPFASRCGPQELACEQFWQYAHTMPSRPAKWAYSTPPTREPSKRIYDMLYKEGDTHLRMPLRREG